MTPGALSAGELAEVDRLKREKYDTWEWNYGRSPKFDVRCKRYWDGGCLEANVSIANGVITDVRFFGDFLSVCGLEELVERLKGVTFQPGGCAGRAERQSGGRAVRRHHCGRGNGHDL